MRREPLMNASPTSELLRAAGGRGPIRITVESKDSAFAKSFEFDQPFVLVGSCSGADLRLDHSVVSRRQVYVQLIGGRLFGVHLSSRTPTLWGTVAQSSGWLDANTPVSFGPFTLKATDMIAPVGPRPSIPVNPLAAASHPGPPATLELLNSSSGKRVVLDRTLTLVGNAPICKVRMNSSRVSSVHCGLVRTGGGLLVVDLASREGVKVNGTLMRAALLGPGDVIDIGGRQLQMTYDTGDLPRLRTKAEDEEELSFNPTELVVPGARPASQPSSNGTADPSAFLHALGPVMDRFSAHQAQTYEQCQEMMTTMLRVFGAMFTEHREFVKDELARLDQLTRDLAKRRKESPSASAPTPSSELEPTHGPAPVGSVPDLSVPLPPLESCPPGEDAHVWLQRRFEEMGEKPASIWQKMAGILRTKGHDQP
jgi:pSer/pThr/pTyr-binding forkhead associated (FHA) protein